MGPILGSKNGVEIGSKFETRIRPKKRSRQLVQIWASRLVQKRASNSAQKTEHQKSITRQWVSFRAFPFSCQKKAQKRDPKIFSHYKKKECYVKNVPNVFRRKRSIPMGQHIPWPKEVLFVCFSYLVTRVHAYPKYVIISLLEGFSFLKRAKH